MNEVELFFSSPTPDICTLHLAIIKVSYYQLMHKRISLKVV